MEKENDIMSSEKIHLLADIYSIRTSEPHFMHSFIWGGVTDYVVFLSEQFSEKVQHLLPADFTSG